MLIMGDIWRCIGIPSVWPFKFALVQKWGERKVSLRVHRERSKTVLVLDRAYWLGQRIRITATVALIQGSAPDDLARLVIEYGDHP